MQPEWVSVKNHTTSPHKKTYNLSTKFLCNFSTQKITQSLHKKNHTTYPQKESHHLQKITHWVKWVREKYHATSPHKKSSNLSTQKSCDLLTTNENHATSPPKQPSPQIFVTTDYVSILCIFHFFRHEYHRGGAWWLILCLCYVMEVIDDWFSYRALEERLL